MKNTATTLATVFLLISAATGRCATLTVTNAADSGPGTLRQAIVDANADASPDLVTIEFNIPNAGVQTIAPLTALPIVTRPVTIDGYTQPGTSSNTLANTDNAMLLIELSGTNVSSDYGLRFQANDCTVRGLVINGFAAQVVFESATNGVAEGNFLGTDASGMGTNAVAGANGVLITGGANHRVGGVTPASRNIISGNWYVDINAGSCTGLQMLGNFIGIGADGSTTLTSPSGWGIYLSECSQAQIGGSVAGARNVASGHTSSCVVNGGASNVIQGNFFGTDATGTLRRTNSYYGVLVQQSAGNLIGGAGPGEGNLLSGNGTGIYLDGLGASNNVIAGNFIGPDVTGTNALGNDAYGVTIVSAPNNTVGGLTPGARNIIAGNPYAGVALSYSTATGNVIQGNYIGLDVTGTNALANETGIIISESPGNRIGGLTPESRNIISGNSDGIVLNGTVGNEILGNYVGLGTDGVTIVSNRSTGIFLHYCTETQIGGPAPGARNVISGNAKGVYANVGGSNVVQGNFIGTDASGALPRGNLNGIVLNESTSNLIGGSNAGEGNLISGNRGLGVSVEGINSTGNVVAGNLIGTDVTGTNALGNGDYGALILSALGNVIGGAAPGAGNVISGNDGIGVAVLGADATNNAVLGNSIFANGTLGLDLGGDGVTPNDPGDADGSPNHFQNFPEIASVKLAAGDLTVSHRVDSAAGNSAYPLTVEFFLADSAASGEGKTLIHRHTYDTPQAFTNITFTPLVAVDDGDPIVATATDANGNTSEFSAVATASANRPPVVVNPIPNTNSTYGAVFSYTFPANTFSDSDAGQTLTYTASNLPPGITFDGPSRTFGGTNTSVGTYVVTVSATDNGSPALSTNDVFDIVVGKAPLTVRALDRTNVYGASIYLGPQYGIEYTGFRFPYDLYFLDYYFNPILITTTATNGSPVGTYPITITGGLDAHYEYVGYESGTLTIAPASLLVQADDYCRAVGQTNPPLTGVLTGVVNNDNITATFASPATAASPVGEYSIIPGLLDPGNVLGNYAVTTRTGKLHVVEFSANYSLVRPFGFPDKMGLSPEAAMVEAGDGVLYGTASIGVFRIGQDGSNYQLICRFPETTGRSRGLTVGGDGVLYGTTFDGGSNGHGSVFRVNRDGTGYQLLHSFTGGPADTDSPTTLIQATNGALYGITLGGFGGGKAVVFRMDTNGANYSILHEFDSANQVQPWCLIQSSDGKLYGTATSWSVSPTVFRIELDGSGFTTVYTFASGLQPSLREASNGVFYGVNTYDSTLFQLNHDGTGYAVLHNFGGGGDGSHPIEAPVEGPDGALYGTTAYGGSGYRGVIYKVNKDGTGYSILHENQFGDGGPDSWGVRLTAGSGGAIHGISGGCLFKFDLNGSAFTITWTFSLSGGDGYGPGKTGLAVGTTGLLEAPDGRLYGTTAEGGSGELGTVFRINKDGSGYELLHQFTGANGEGRWPAAPLIEGQDGALYGSTSNDSTNNSGAIFRLNHDGSDFAVLHTFGNTPGEGAGPAGPLVQDSDGKLYGVTRLGGTNYGGTLFSMNTNGTAFTTLRHFSGADGGGPMGLTHGSDDYFYIPMSFGGVNYAGAIFRLQKDGSGQTVIHDFGSSTDGSSPDGPLRETTDGTLYGVANSGGTYGFGTVFKLNKDGSGFSTLYHFGSWPHDGTYPVGAVTPGPDGALYGQCINGGLFGPYSAGVIFRITTNGSDYCVLHHFGRAGTSDGSAPHSTFLLASDGALYGTTSDQLGAIFRLAIGGNQPPTLAQLIPDQTNTYGSSFHYTFDADTFSEPDAGQTLDYSASGLPPGITFDGPSRTFSGTPTNVGTFSVTVTATDNGTPPLSANDEFDISVAKAPLVVTAYNKSKLQGQPNPPLDGTLVGVTNNDPISVNFTTTANTGSPPGNYPITPVFYDPDTRLPNYTVTTNIGTLTVIDCSTLAITNAALPNATRGVPYSATLGATNGTMPYTFALTGGTLPGNVMLAPSGLLSGTPTNTGSFPITVAVTSAVGCVANSNYVLNVVCPAITVLPTGLPDGNRNADYNQTITASGGSAPYSFGVTSGALPPGLTLSSAGSLSGTPTTSGDYSFTVTATDSGGCTGAKTYTISIPLPVYEGFAYSPGAGLNGQTGGTGFSAAWSGDSSFGILDGSLSTGVPTSGNHLSLGGNGVISRPLSQAIGAAGTVRYLSVVATVLYPSFGPPPPGADRVGMTINGTTGVGLFFGKPNAANKFNWVFENAAGGGQVVGPPMFSVVPSTLVLLVVKCEFFAGNDRFTLFVNPTPGQPEPASGTVKFDTDLGTVTNLAFTVSSLEGFWKFDEIRLAATFAEAVPVIPSAIVLKNESRLPSGAFQFTFTNVSGATFTTLATTNVSLGVTNWTELGPATEVSPGQFQFTDPQATNHTQRFYGVRSP